MTAPEWDAEGFAAWLRRWRDAERLQWKEIAERSGLSRGALQALATASSATRRPGPQTTMPSVVTMAKLAHGLGLEVGYVLEKAGLATHLDSRWRNFSTAERTHIARALHEYELRRALTGTFDPEHASDHVPSYEGRKLTEELDRFLQGRADER